ncbi:cell division protein ZapA [Bacillus chungangensis]|uniref:Cell division protein ZapA n=1 Tax=Bacillus chungangensis TaxID=587633 RepID=A0ABT9WMJ5_9BACI|nr:cell division protein ZapA [Bacillus chungangensis]MDQ0174503.1 cell division protein ZapA [Bacillus chungangensis]
MSDENKRRTSVGIYGQQYIIIGTESNEHIRRVAASVDEKMRQISAKNPALDISKLAVLTAVNAVNDYIKLKEQYDLLESEFKKLKD